MTNDQFVPSYVVGIGASAGGLDAIERFFENVPKETSMAFVLVQHLSPDFKSLMDELLARRTTLPIHLVEDGMRVERGHVYLIPPKKEMIISDGRLLLSDRDRQQELTLPIDLFFRSLARDCGARAVAVVLSGSGSDGSRGIRDVYEAGGLVLVQDSDSAQFDGMPRMARESGFAHFVLGPGEMPRVLADHEHAGEQPSSVPSRRGESADSTAIGAVYRMLQEEFGIDFTHYKPSTVTRRIERRLALARSQNIEEYVRRLRDERAELDVLYQDLLIGVTRFFRDEEAFTVLENEVLPELFQREPRDTPFRVWVAGCATGEEAYSLAIVLQELMRVHGQRTVKIFATDVHRGSLERANRAIYGSDAVRNVSEERLGRYFTRVGESFQVVPELRQMLVFAQHNVIKDAPFTRVDLVSCRNLLIYLQPAAQHKILSLFHFALNRGGALFLGPSESAGPLTPGFANVDKHWRIYRKQNDVRISIDSRIQPHAKNARPSAPPLRNQAGRYTLSHLLGTYESLLGEVMPPSLLVSDRGELVHSFGGANRFLRMRDGRQGLDVLDLVDPGLKLVLVGGLKRALHERSPIVYRNVRVGEELHAVTVRPILGKDGEGNHLLVSIERPPQVESERPAEPAIELDQASHEQLKMLDAELNHTRESLQAAIEELEASNEELQASNEELQASNEELQSTNEELQSVNEELYTVNAEYQRKITELTELTNDMDNLLSSTEIATIFLDRDLNIRKFTPQIAETFTLVPHDVGRSIETFAHRMDHPELVEDLKRVVATELPIERHLSDVNGKSFYLRVLPYRARGAVDGVVLTLTDLSGLKAAEDALFHERYLFNSLLASVPDAIYFKDASGRFIRANPAMAVRLGLRKPADAVGKTGMELPDRKLGLALHEMDDAVFRSGEAQFYKLERRAATSERWDLVSRLPLRDDDGEIVGLVVIFRDVTDQKRAEAKIQEAVRRRDQFLAMLSHELRNPLGAIVTATALLKNDGIPLDSQARKFVEILDRQSQQMARLLEDLLEASRVTQNMIDLRRQIVDLRTVAKDAADAVRAQMDAQGVRFAIDLDDGPLSVDGDPARLLQIHVNLLSNAAKYTPKGGHVELSARREGEHAIIRVRDDGAGIPRDMLDSIFDLFVQAQNTLDRSAGGLGVGLTLVRSLVTMHGGTVVAQSDGEGRGTEVVVRLPLVSAEATTPAPHEWSAVKTPSNDRVLVVEDNADSREMLCRLLERAGFDCRSTDNGKTALALIEELAPEIAILDIGLPGMDGFEIARRIRKNGKHIRLVGLTGYGQATDRAAATEAGFDAHVVKPVLPDELVRLLIDLRRDAHTHGSSVEPPESPARARTETPESIPPDAS
jgi:two-component system CheB/CheR fusion protein